MKRPSYTAYMADHDAVALTDNASTIPDRPKSQANTPLSHGLERRFSSIHRVTFYWTYVRTLLHTCLRVLRDATHPAGRMRVCPIKDKRPTRVSLRQANCTRNIALDASFCTFAHRFYDYYREYHFRLAFFRFISNLSQGKRLTR